MLRVFHLYPFTLFHQEPRWISTLQHRGRRLIRWNLCLSPGQTDSLFLRTPGNSCWFGSFPHFSLLLWLQVLWADLVFLLCGWTALRGITSGHENRAGKSPNDNLGKSRAENPAYAFLQRVGPWKRLVLQMCLLSWPKTASRWSGTCPLWATRKQRVFCSSSSANTSRIPLLLPKKRGVPAIWLINVGV